MCHFRYLYCGVWLKLLLAKKNSAATAGRDHYGNASPCHTGSETIDMDPTRPKAIWALRTNVPVLFTWQQRLGQFHSQKGIPAFSLTVMTFRMPMTNPSADVVKKLLRFAVLVWLSPA